MSLRCCTAFALSALLAAGCGGVSDQPQPLSTPPLPPAPAHSAQPRLTVDPNDSLILSWTTDDPGTGVASLEYSRLDDGEWSQVVEIARGDNWFVNWADFPSVLVLSQDHWAAHWLVTSGPGTYTYDVVISQSTDGGISWSEPMKPHLDETESEHGFVSLYPHESGVGAVWLDGRESMLENRGMTLRSAVLGKDGQPMMSLQVDDLVCDCCQTSVSIGNAGPVLAYRNRTTAEVRDIYTSRLVKNQWESSGNVGGDNWVIGGCPVNGPALDADNNTVALAWFTMGGGQARVRLAWSTNAGLSFAEPVDLDDSTPLGRVDVALLKDGSAVVSWLRQLDNQSANLILTKVWPDGRRGVERIVAVTQASRMSGFPQIIAVRDRIWVAWTALEERHTRVRLASVSADSL